MMTQTLVLLFFVTVSQPLHRSDVVDVDRVEINTVCECGEVRFTQVVLWRWSSQLHRFLVAEWQMLPSGYHRRGDTLRWTDAEFRIHRVRAKSVIVTRGIDSEMAERKQFPEGERTPYFATE